MVGLLASGWAWDDLAFEACCLPRRRTVLFAGALLCLTAVLAHVLDSLVTIRLSYSFSTI